MLPAARGCGILGLICMYWIDVRKVRSFFAKDPLAKAFGISLAIHLALYGGWSWGKKLGWWDHQATWLLKLTQKKKKPVQLVNLQPVALAAPREIPLTFVEVDPSTVALEPPKDAKYYGAQSTKAANPDAVIQSLVPKVDGTQTKMVRLENVPKPAPLQPTAPVEPKKTAETLQPKPKGGETPGDMAKAKPLEVKKPKSDGAADTAKGETTVVTHEKPRTLAAARAQKATLTGEKMKQEGGAKVRGLIAFDVKATPFGSYDAAFIAAVQQRWSDLLESTQFAQRSGKVVLEFRLYFDGRIADMKVNGNEVGEMLGLLCQRAILDPAPYAKWPSDMRLLNKDPFRLITFTFYYE